MAAENVATLRGRSTRRVTRRRRGPGVTLPRTRAVNSFNAEVTGTVVGSTFLAITLTDTEKTLTTGELTVTCNGNPVTLTAAAYDASGNQTNTANFFADAGVAYFAPDTAGSYTITSTADIESVDVIQTTVFATLDEGNTTLTDSAANYKVQDTEAARKYRVQLVLGKAEGDGDYLLAETDELTGSAAYNGSLSFSLTGSLAPTGDYYPSILLAEYIEAEGENGEVVKTWTLVDQKTFPAPVHYTNDVIPAAPANVSLYYSGNEVMYAVWTPVQDADAYQIAVYDAAGKDTGLLFRTEDASNSLYLDLSSLESGRNYSVGVKALLNKADGTYQFSYERLSAPTELKTAVRPTITYSDNVTLGEASLHTLSVGADGGSFTISSENQLNMEVTFVSDNGQVMSLANEATTRSLRCDIPAMGEDAKPLTLTVTAVDPDTTDYVLDTITVSYDTIAPPLILDSLGAYTLGLTDAGYIANVTGHAEAGASVLVYQKENSWADTYSDFIAGTTAGEDGNFSIPLQFSSRPGKDDAYCVVATDAAGNASASMGVTFKDAEVTVNFDPNGENAVCSTGSVGIASGASIGTLPVPFWSDGSRLFDGWYCVDNAGAEVDVSETTVFTADTTLYAAGSPLSASCITRGTRWSPSTPSRRGGPSARCPRRGSRRRTRCSSAGTPPIPAAVWSPRRPRSVPTRSSTPAGAPMSP